MPFNFLLTNHLLNNTSWNESGTKISISPESGEKILFFKMDDGDNSNDLKKALNIKQSNQLICDLLIYYQKYDKSGIKKIACLAEGKGKDIKHAVEQIENMYKAFSSSLPQSVFSQLVWAAYIQVNPGSSSKNTKEFRQELINIGIKKCDIGKNKFENFIRNI
jgi:hypothetical protein